MANPGISLRSVTTIVALLLLTISTGNGRGVPSCDIQQCFNFYNSLRTLFSHTGIDLSEFGDDPNFGADGGPTNVALLECSLRKNLTHCMKREEKRCRGDLNYHSLGGLINRLRKNNYRENCSAAAIHHHGIQSGSESGSGSGSREGGGRPVAVEEPIIPSSKHTTSTAPSTPGGHHGGQGQGFGHRRRNGSGGGAHKKPSSEADASDGDDDNMKLSDILLSKGGRNRILSSSEEDDADEEDDDDDDGWDLGGGDNDAGSTLNKCIPKQLHAHQSKPAGCALYGLTNLKSFHDPLNFTDFRHCSLTGSWSLIDTPEFAVQITNKEGYPPMPKDVTMTTLVTVILKHNDCSQRRTYQATYDEVPGMFTDGSTSAGTVRIETIIPSEHVRINMHYFQASIDIVKVVGQLPIPSLSITIKMPQVNVTNLIRHPSKISGLPLCFYGCPKVASLQAIKARSVPSYKCTPPKKRSRSSSSVEDGSEETLPTALAQHREEFLDTSTSINAAICDSLLTVQSILGDKSVVLKERLAIPGEDTNIYATMSDQSGSQQMSSSASGISGSASPHSPTILKYILSQYVASYFFVSNYQSLVLYFSLASISSFCLSWISSCS